MPLYPPQAPIALQFPINDICNSRCQMCNIWKQQKDYEISPADIRQILQNPLFKKVRNVGINGGEPTLRKDVAEVVRAVVETLPSVQIIHFITNAIRHKTIISAISSLGSVCHDNNVKLDVMVSLDGIGSIHDRVRRRPGNFESAVQVLNFVQTTNKVDFCRIGCTVIKENVYYIEDVLDWCRKRDLYALFRLGIPHRRLYSLDVTTPFTLNSHEKFHFANFLDYLYFHYEKTPSRKDFYRSLRDQLIYNSPRSVTCLWQCAGATLSSRGELCYCAVESNTLGNALKENPETLYWQNTDHLKQIYAEKCPNCFHDYSPAPPPKEKHSFINLFTKKITPKLVRTTVNRYLTTRRKSSSLQHLIKRAKSATSPSSHRKLPNRILICGWYGTETLGDKAILGGLVQALHHNSQVNIDVASLAPYITQYTKLQMPGLKIEKILSLNDAKTAISRGDYCCLMMGGGPLMGAVHECLEMLDLFILAKEIGTTTVVGGCGLGPLGWPDVDPAIGELLRIADHVLFRDNNSRTESIKSFNTGQESKVVLDPAFSWIKNTLDPKLPRNPKQILLALRDWSLQDYRGDLEYEKAKKIKARFENEICLMVDHLLTTDPEIKIIPFCMHKYAIGGDDRFFYKRIFADKPEILEYLENKHLSPQEDLKTFVQSHAVLAMRFHSLVFALATQTPVMAIDYTLGGKITGLLQDLGALNLRLNLASFDGKETAKQLLAGTPKPPDVSAQIIETENTIREVITSALSNVACKENKKNEDYPT